MTPMDAMVTDRPPTMQCAPGDHVWDAGEAWNIVLGVSTCSRCGRMETTAGLQEREAEQYKNSSTP